MAESSRAVDASGRQARAERILDVAAELLLQFGYRRVTIEDVAERADVGKGTVYLHWRSRETLFYAVIERDYLALLDHQIEQMRRDPDMALLHRLMPAFYAELLRRPLLRGAFAGDLEMLGRIAKVVDRRMDARANAMFEAYMRILREHGLVRDDLDVTEASWAIGATTGGYLIEPAGDRDIPVERQAELLAMTLQRTFEPSTPAPPEAVRAAAPGAIRVFTEIADILRADVARAYE